MEQGMGEDFGSEIPTRPMRVKVLYSFDQENKTNCLARIPNTLQIPAVAIDENAQVGVIELQQCLQTIVAASPELITRLSDGDFTVYAFDYSEADTPMVGQGMLSALLAAQPGAEKAMITGRVCKNLPAIFSGGVKETLEVKLRLTPVPRPATATVVAKSVSPATSAGFDPNAWNASMQQSRSQQQQGGYFDLGMGTSMSDSGMALMDEVLGMGSASSGGGSGRPGTGAVGMAQTPTDPAFGFNPAFSHSAPGSRAGSPMMGLDSSTHNDLVRHQSFSAAIPTFSTEQSRPASRASVRSEVPLSHHKRQASTQSLPPQQLQVQNETAFNEDGQPRKRAKVTQADWRGRSSFGAKSADLRVTAATAHSVHMHRPIAKKPAAPGSDLEPPPRAPTPVPRGNPMLRQGRSSLGPSRSLLRQASTMTMDSDLMSDADQFSDAIVESPEDGSPNNSIIADASPQDIPSSPPVLMQTYHMQPSSPQLPILAPRLPDSGYMSGCGLYSMNALDSQYEDDENRSPDAQDLEVAAQYAARNARQPTAESTDSTQSQSGTEGWNVNLETPGDMDQLPQKMLISRYRQSHQGSKQARPAAVKKIERGPATPAPEEPSIKSEPVGSRRGSLALPSLAPASDAPEQPLSATSIAQPPAKKKRTYTKRARTDPIPSEVGSPAPSDTEGRPKGPKRSGSGAVRRVVIQQRLEAAIAIGQEPQFCSHCGAIDTPTWRKLYVKTVVGRPTDADSQEADGEKVGVEALEWDADTSEVTKYVVRKSMKVKKDSEIGEGFETVDVCNPCGLWFNKHRKMRPSERWNKEVLNRRSKKQRINSGEEPATDGLEPPSEAFFTDQIIPEDALESEDSSTDLQQRPDAGNKGKQQPPAKRPRASSMQPQPRRRSGNGMTASQLDAALTRAVQSSPVPFRGSQESPIEISPTPRPTRRLLFPSPRRDGEVKSLDDNGQASLNATPPSKRKTPGSNSTHKAVDFAANANVNIFEAFTSLDVDKENLDPTVDGNDDLMHLFEGSTTVFKTPSKTPSKPNTTPRSQRTLDYLLKTPTPSSRKRKPSSTPRANLPNDFLTSPSSSRYFLRSTPSRAERTPARSSQQQHGPGNEMTPFSRHLAQILSDANEAAVFTSPSRALDFGDLPSFNTPGGKSAGGTDMGWMDEMLAQGSDLGSFGGGGEGSEA